MRLICLNITYILITLVLMYELSVDAVRQLVASISIDFPPKTELIIYCLIRVMHTNLFNGIVHRLSVSNWEFSMRLIKERFRSVFKIEMQLLKRQESQDGIWRAFHRERKKSHFQKAASSYIHLSNDGL